MQQNTFGEATRSIAIFCIVLLTVSVISSCGQQDCPWRYEGDRWQRMREAERQRCEEEIIREYERCLIMTGGDVDVCEELYAYDEQVCSFLYAKDLNLFLFNECGAVIYDIEGEPGDPDFSIVPSQKDTDGDGVSDYIEVEELGSNPCAEICNSV